jgi:TRAP transporter TAXI family solute receptor
MARMASAWTTLVGAGRFVLLALAVALAAPPPSPARAETPPQGDVQFFRIGSGAVDSPSFALAGLIAAGLSSPPGARPCEHGGSCGVPGMIALAQAIGSAAEAIDLLEQRQIDAILVPAGDAYRAYATKRPDGPKPRAALRSVATLFLEAVHAVVRGGARFETIEDLRKRPVAGATDDPSAAGFVQLYMNQLGLDAGRKPAPVQTIQAGLQRLADRKIDGLIVVATAPQTALIEFAHLVPIHLLAITPTANARLPYVSEVRLPVGSYPGVEALDLPALPTQLFVAAGADADRIEAITRALWNDATLKLLAGGPLAARNVRAENALLGIVVPLHPGAARFYREAGTLNNTPVGD